MKLKEVALKPLVARYAPFCMAFVYSPKGNILVKGNSEAVHNRVERDYPRAVVNYTFVQCKSFRSFWRFYSPVSIFLDTPNKPFGGRGGCTNYARKSKFSFYYYSKSGKGTTTLLELRRIPKKWIPEYDAIIQKALNDKEN